MNKDIYDAFADPRGSFGSGNALDPQSVILNP